MRAAGIATDGATTDGGGVREKSASWLGEKLEDNDGFIPKTMLCLPIFNGSRDVIGVAQLINKVKQDYKLDPWQAGPVCGKSFIAVLE